MCNKYSFPSIAQLKYNQGSEMKKKLKIRASHYVIKLTITEGKSRLYRRDLGFNPHQLMKKISLDERVTHSVKGWSRNNMPVNAGGGRDRYSVLVETVGGKLNYFQAGI